MSEAPIAMAGRAPMSRAMNQVSGAAVAPMSANGMSDTQAAVPSTAMNGSWMSDARGSQWALLGIGRMGIGRQDAAGLHERPDEIDVESLARVERARDVHVVVRVGVRGVRIEGDEDGPDDEREREKADGDAHSRCSVAPGPAPSDQYESVISERNGGPSGGFRDPPLRYSPRVSAGLGRTPARASMAGWPTR